MSSADVPVFVPVPEKERCGGERERSSVREFYRNRNVLVTGGTGFLGKVLIEKLLRSCEDIGTIYLIIRPKKGSTPEERLKDLLSLEVFDRLHAERPTARNKVVAIEGDLSEAKFILNERDKTLIENVVSVVFHSAANIKFDSAMKEAVNINVRGTKNMMDLAKGIKNLKAFIHMSTAYSNSDRLVIEEKYYPPKAPKHYWKDLITAAEKIDEKELNALTPGLIGNLPNTYTFTKQIGESVVYDHKDDIPIVIYRPSIVISAFSDPTTKPILYPTTNHILKIICALNEPQTGWVGSFNPAVSLITGFYTGFMHMALATKYSVQDYIFVDFVVNGAIAAAWQRSHEPLGTCPTYNFAAGRFAVNCTELHSIMEKEIRCEIPTEKCIWKPTLTVTPNLLWFQLNFIIFNLLPAFFIDIGFKASGVDFSLVRVCRKAFALSRVLAFFSLTTFDIKHDNVLKLYDKMTIDDKKIFNFDLVSSMSNRLKVKEGVKVVIYGIKKYVLQDNMNDDYIENLRHRVKYYDWVHMAAKIIFFAFFANIMWKCLHSYILSSIEIN